MGFSSWLESKFGRNKKVEVVESVISSEGKKITFKGTLKDKEIEKSYFVEQANKALGVMILRNTKKVTSNTKYWTYNEKARQIKTLKTSKIILEDVYNYSLQD